MAAHKRGPRCLGKRAVSLKVVPTSLIGLRPMTGEWGIHKGPAFLPVAGTTLWGHFSSRAPHRLAETFVYLCVSASKPSFPLCPILLSRSPVGVDLEGNSLMLVAGRKKLPLSKSLSKLLLGEHTVWLYSTECVKDFIKNYHRIKIYNNWNNPNVHRSRMDK